MAIEIPKTNNTGSSVNVNDIQNVQLDGYTDADNTADLIAQNQQNTKIIPGMPGCVPRCSEHAKKGKTGHPSGCPMLGDPGDFPDS